MDALTSLLPMGLPLIPITKTLGITSSAILAGTALSSSLFHRAVLPSAEDPSSTPPAAFALRARFTRLTLYTAIPTAIAASSCYTFLGLSTPSDALALRVLYTTAALLPPLSITLGLLASRPLLSAPASPSGGFGLADGDADAPPSANPTRAVAATAATAALLSLGAWLGAWAALNEAFMGGVQVGANYIIEQLMRQQALRDGAAAGAA